LREKDVRHPQPLVRRLHLAAIVYSRAAKLVLEEAFVVIPLFPARPLDVFAGHRIFALHSGLLEQSKVEKFDWLAALERKLGSNSLLVFHALDFVASLA